MRLPYGMHRGLGFFNKQTALGRVRPAYLRRSRWAPELGVDRSQSTENQVRLAAQILDLLPPERRGVFCLLTFRRSISPLLLLPDAERSREWIRSLPCGGAGLRRLAVAASVRRAAAAGAVACDTLFGSRHSVGEEGYKGIA